MEQKNTIILGAGLAGLSAAYHLDDDNYSVHEKNSNVGGLARSVHVDGFKFDYAPHILFSHDEYTANLIKELLEDELNFIKRESFIYHNKYKKYTRYPFQVNLYGLPENIVDECVNDLKEALEKQNDVKQPTNYEEWLYWRFGKGIAEQLMIPYSEKIWTVPAKDMNYDWIAERVPQPDFDMVMKGAYSDLSELIGFHSEFWYPKSGAVEALPNALSRRINNIYLNSRITGINVKEKKIQFNRKDWKSYNHIISSLALPLLVSLIDDIPENIKQAASELEHNSVVCVNIGVDRSRISDHHWLYFYEDDFIFHRLSFQMNFSQTAAPKGKSSICCEIAFSRHKPLSVKGKQAIIDKTVQDLIKADILKEDDKIVTTNFLSIKYAYVIYDLKHRQNVNLIHNYLEDHGIYCCGRFGEWEYFNMDHSMMSGQRAAQKVNALNN